MVILDPHWIELFCNYTLYIKPSKTFTEIARRGKRYYIKPESCVETI